MWRNFHTPLVILLGLAFFTVLFILPSRAVAATDKSVPPLPRGCGAGGTPIDDFAQAVCCVSGYVYANGAPVADALVTIRANGAAITVQTAQPPNAVLPYYSASLSAPPLNVQPGDEVTVTATANGQSKTVTFVAQVGGQQVDAVLPHDRVEGAWQRARRFPPRSSAALAYDADRQRMVLFGGASHGVAPANDTWEWDGNAWQEMTPRNVPRPRWAHAMAYDADRKRIVLFSGSTQYGTYEFGDTWEWDGNDWQKMTPTNSPGRLERHAMVYDPVQKKVVLFGGVDPDFISNETWEWDGTSWAQRMPTLSPTARELHSIAYDATRQRIVLFGGRNDNGTRLNDTWEWDGNAWQEIFPPTSPSPRTGPTMAYDPGRQKIILFGGYNSLNDTWEWNGVNWSKLNTPTSPPPDEFGTMVYDTARNAMLLLTSGDYNNSNEGKLWELSGNNWVLREDYSSNSALSLPLLQGAAMSYAGNGQSLLFGGRFINDQGVLDWEIRSFGWNGMQWQEFTPAQTPPARQNHRLAYNSDTNQVLLFGGVGTNGQPLSDTWLWGNSQWTQQTPALSPPPRTLPAMTYDGQRKVWVLFGGQDNQTYLGDTWEYDRVNWIARFPTNAPTPSTEATLTYDPLRQRTVLIGGRSATGYLNDVWEWDGTTWTEVAPSGSRLPARAMHNAAYDAKEKLILVAGGQSSTQVFTDTWAWRGSYWQPHNTERWDIPALTGQVMTYDEAQQRIIIAFADGDDADQIYPYQILNTPSSAAPVATIQRISPRDARHGSDTLTLQGGGQDADSSDQITAYRWTLGGIVSDTVLSTQATFTLPAASLPLGEQVIALSVQDNEGTWSPPVRQTVYIRDGAAGNGSTPANKQWTLLIYAVADNNLDLWLGDYAASNGMLHRLKSAVAQPNVQVAVLYDGPGSDDTRRYTLSPTGQWAVTTLPEARMGEAATLRDFVQWGLTNFASDYVALHLVDHANGVVGFGQDDTSNDFLTPLELRLALQEATDDGARKLDLLHYDGCSFGLLEDAAIARGLAHYIVASANTGWGVFAYDAYRQRAGSAETPLALAREVAQTYAIAVGVEERPYTIAALDMAHFEAMNRATGDLVSFWGEAESSRVPKNDRVRRLDRASACPKGQSDVKQKVRTRQRPRRSARRRSALRVACAKNGPRV
jgi:hypothetical protein